MIQKINSIPSAETKDDSSTIADVTTSSPNNAKPMLGAVASDIKDNKIMLLEEDLWCVHKYLDDLGLPRADKDGKEYSIVGRIKRLEERYLKQMSELETMHFSGNCT